MSIAKYWVAVIMESSGAGNRHVLDMLAETSTPDPPPVAQIFDAAPHFAGIPAEGASYYCASCGEANVHPRVLRDLTPAPPFTNLGTKFWILRRFD